MYKITVESSFSAAHHLRNYRGNCENIHGHNWKVLVTAKFGELSSDGLTMDFRDLKDILQKILDKIDHKDLNEIEYFKDKNPTSENIAEYIYRQIKEAGVPLGNVRIFETDKYSAEYSEN
ncbi:6-carboxytetrahydropterin synthase QueD [Elusimicrobiota bacterium]